MEICVKISLIFPYFLFFLFQSRFIIYIDLTHIAASNTTTDDVTNYVTQNI